jgi:hypothetical protein
LIRGKYILLFLMSLLQLNIFYFSLVGLVDFSQSTTTTTYLRVNAAFSAIGVILVILSIISVLAYNIYFNCYTSDT